MAPIKKTEPKNDKVETTKSIKVAPSKKSITKSGKSLLSSRVRTAEGLKREKIREKSI